MVDFKISEVNFFHNLNWGFVTGEHARLKFREFIDDITDPSYYGFRIPQDIYELVGINSYLATLEKNRGIFSEMEFEKVQKSINDQLELVITWKDGNMRTDKKPDSLFVFRILGNPFKPKQNVVIPRLKPDIQNSSISTQKEEIVRTEKIFDIYTRYEREHIRPYYNPMEWSKDHLGNLHLICAKQD